MISLPHDFDIGLLKSSVIFLFLLKIKFSDSLEIWTASVLSPPPPYLCVPGQTVIWKVNGTGQKAPRCTRSCTHVHICTCSCFPLLSATLLSKLSSISVSDRTRSIQQLMSDSVLGEIMEHV